MDPNILLAQAPSTVLVGDACVPLDTTHRTGIQAMRLIDDPLVDQENKVRTLLFLYFGCRDATAGRLELPPAVADDPQTAIEAVLSFFNLNEPKPPENPGGRPPAGTRVFDWDWDAGRVIADFQREYRIDLTDPTRRLHWWLFWSLFRGLGENSQTMEAIRVRGTVPDEKKMGREAVEQLMKRKAALMLPARTEEEALQLTNLRFRWALEI